MDGKDKLNVTEALEATLAALDALRFGTSVVELDAATWRLRDAIDALTGADVIQVHAASDETG